MGQELVTSRSWFCENISGVLLFTNVAMKNHRTFIQLTSIHFHKLSNKLSIFCEINQIVVDVVDPFFLSNYL